MNGRDSIVRQAIKQRRHAVQISRSLMAEIEAMQKEIATKLALGNPRNRQGLERLLVSIDEIILGGYGSIAEQAADELTKMGVVQAGFASRLATKMGVGAMPVDADWVRSAVVNDPFDGQLLDEWIARQRIALTLGVKRRVRLGIASGESTANIAKALLAGDAGEFTAGKRFAETMIRTAATAITAKADEELFSRAGVATYQLSAVLDTRTTPICQGLDGQVFAYSDSKAPRPPLHPGCRTVMIPVFDGETAIKENYEQWLARQDEATQIDALGMTRFQEWRAGKSLGAFVE
ncbi:minor capsid protein [Pseudomonas koreensis]|uniref:minor capsid protein n=1 Tax=Pseudomonas koreensis TaxID=198620 RepID=UPI0020778B05|nr:minor capsid protein [Pseudomonas koreensis]MCM8742325.1 minor capsid protein [Pseudomonas koreensis]